MDPPFGEGRMAEIPPDQLDDPAFGHGFTPAAPPGGAVAETLQARYESREARSAVSPDRPH